MNNKIWVWITWQKIRNLHFYENLYYNIQRFYYILYNAIAW